MGKNTEERKQVAKAIWELHKLYISTGEADKPMTISLDDLARMAEQSNEVTEQVLTEFIDEKIISTENRKIIILKKRKLKSVAGISLFGF